MLPPPSADNELADLRRRMSNLETALTSAFTTISGGRGIRIIDGGRLALVSADGVLMFYIGPVNPNQADGSPQPGWAVRRADGSLVLSMRDAFPEDDGGVLRQALNWFDRSGNIVLADDTNSGQGLARPWIPGVWERARAGDWPQVTGTSWDTVYRAKMPKQHPNLRAAVWTWNDTVGGVSEVRVMVNNNQLGPTVSPSSSLVGESLFGPSPVAGAHMSELVVEIQARMISGPGGVRCCPSTPPEGRQS